MIHYILADLKRITRRIPVLVCTVLIIAMLVFLFLSSYYTQDWNSIDFGRILQVFLDYAPIFVGLFVFISVFADDFKAKTMQMAIGTGCSRKAVVLAKFLELCAVTVIVLLILGVVTVIMGFVLDARLIASQYLDFLKAFLEAGTNIIGFSSISMILAFFTQSAGGATLFYLALSTGILRQLFDLLFHLKYIEGLHLDQMQFNALSEKAFARLANDVFDVRSFLGIAVIIVGAVLITMFVFRKRELEF